MKNDPHAKLASMAAKLLAIAIDVNERGADPEEYARIVKLHDAEKLYPRLVIRSPHGGGAVSLQLSLCDPATGEEVERLFEGIGEAVSPLCFH